ncbi:FkbM family methyltransferase [Variovorax sp. Sphag1AA]|uniref:FkbM family methyltransferase n=1 Tax=Variovorax sp. Sphag1AA TaxID=2587027 RepID=UPI001609F2DF|nr:FkbM family methyltransferase [Variovorax sp. Sphag1AA]MBB3179824.1 FkbM family methyltransferase [Variovorax sp. Sphag1AA]
MTEGKETTRPLRVGRQTFEVTTDDAYLDEMNGVFEPHTVALFKAIVKPGDVALDVGANIGCTSLLVGQTASKVFAFEPGSRTYALLARNIAQSGLQNVQAENVGLGSKAAEFDLVFNPENRSGGFVSTSNADAGQVGHQKERIRILRGDDYVREHGIERVDFIKIDVEGFEQDVVIGLAETIANHRPVVTLELNHWCLNAFQRSSVPQYLDFLRSVFPVLYAFHVDEAKNLHDEAEGFEVLRDHVLGFKYMVIVGAFDESQIEDFLQLYWRKSRRYIQLEQQHETDLREIAELRATGHDLRAEIARLSIALSASEAKEREALSEVAAMLRSKSWKITAPLRALRRRAG